ncbi:MAG: glycosyltransferase, partial [Methanobacteriaceae archaeon]|nr:glycosyltransferase [Methanobacteriaceae archaeon]
MRILIVSPYFYPKAGGLENYAYNIFKRFNDNFDVTVLCSNHSPENSIDSFKRIRVIRLKPSLVVSNTPIRWDLVLKLSKLLKREDFDLVNAHMPVPSYADMAAIATRKNQTPFILTYHNDVVKDGLLGILASFYNKTLLQFTLKSTDKIITPSPYVYNESLIIRKFADKTVLIPPG